MKFWPHNSTKETRWVHTREPADALREIFFCHLNMHYRTAIVQHPKKWLKYMHASLFSLLPSNILADIDIWLSDLEHCNKFKHVISSFKYMSNLVISKITHKLWTPYHNCGALLWYNQVKYDWSHRRILDSDDGHWTHYEYYTNTSKYITQLTPELLRHR